MQETLQALYKPDGPERVGFILNDGTVVEVENIAEDPIKGFDVSDADLLALEDAMVASWHTHPGQTGNLSLDDHDSFLQWSHLVHHIIGNDGVWTFKVVDGIVLNDAG